MHAPALLAALWSAAVLAHPGGLDAQGCHRDSRSGERHCHSDAPAAAQLLRGPVVAVLDGDTVDVLVDSRPVRVRLHGVDCPEKAQPFGAAAKRFTADATAGAVVEVRVRDTDRYGRRVGELRLGDGSSLNQALVRAGLAWWYRRYAPSDTELRRLEEEARAAKRGLWSDPRPTEPWVFRRTRR